MQIYDPIGKVDCYRSLGGSREVPIVFLNKRWYPRRWRNYRALFAVRGYVRKTVVLRRSISDAQKGIHNRTVLDVYSGRLEDALERAGLGNADRSACGDMALHFPLDDQIAHLDRCDNMTLALDNNIPTGGEIADSVIASDLEVLEDKALFAVRAEDRHRPKCNVAGVFTMGADHPLDCSVPLFSNYGHGRIHPPTWINIPTRLVHVSGDGMPAISLSPPVHRFWVDLGRPPRQVRLRFWL